jgi:membrane-associated phospholipid phosphatase
MVLESWRPCGRLRPALKWSARLGLVLFFLLMCFGAVYLDHHWIIDVVAGVAYALATFCAFRLGAYLLASRSAAVRNGEVQRGTTAAA